MVAMSAFGRGCGNGGDDSYGKGGGYGGCGSNVGGSSGYGGCGSNVSGSGGFQWLFLYVYVYFRASFISLFIPIIL